MKEGSARGSRLRLDLAAAGAPRQGALWNLEKPGTREPWRTQQGADEPLWCGISAGSLRLLSLPSLPFEHLNPDVIPGVQNTNPEALMGPLKARPSVNEMQAERGKLFSPGIPQSWLETRSRQAEALPPRFLGRTHRSLNVSFETLPTSEPP